MIRVTEKCIYRTVMIDKFRKQEQVVKRNTIWLFGIIPIYSRDTIMATYAPSFE